MKTRGEEDEGCVILFYVCNQLVGQLNCENCKKKNLKRLFVSERTNVNHKKLCILPLYSFYLDVLLFERT